MPNGLMDLGGGAQMMDFGSILGQAASLMNLKNQGDPEMEAMRKEKLRVDTQLANNELLNVNVSNLKQKADLFKALGDERRAEGKYKTEVLKGVYDLFKVNAQLGAAALQQVMPEAQARMKEDGTVEIEWPTQEMEQVDGQPTQTPKRDKILINIDPNAPDPEKKAALEGQWYDRFQKNASVQDYGVVSRQFRNLKSASALATGQGDIAVVFSFMKMLDPAGTVREGEQATVKNSPGVPDQIRNMYNRALTQEAPLFGKKDSAIRKNFVAAAEQVYGNIRSDVISVGRDLVEMAKRERLNPRNVITPVGDLTENDLVDTEDDRLARLRSLATNPPATGVTP